MAATTTFTIEDFNDQLKINLFGKDYLEYKNYLTEGYCILLKAKIEKRAFPPDSTENEIKIHHMSMLTDVKENMIKSISLSVPIQVIDDNFINTLSQNTKEGKVLLKFVIFDPSDKVRVEMFSRSQKVSITNKFVDFLETHDEIEFKVN